MRYRATQHRKFANYLRAVDDVLTSHHTPTDERDEVAQNLIEQFEAAAESSVGFDEEGFIAQLDDPGSYVPETATSPHPPILESTPPVASRGNSFWKILISLVGLLSLVLLGGYLISAYNTAFKEKSLIDARWADVEATLQRRYDLIPNLISTVKAFAVQEEKVLANASRLRDSWTNANTPEEKRNIVPEMETTIIAIMAVSQQYPVLKSSDQFINLQYQMEGTENRIAVARIRFNEAASRYNATITQFPANLFGFVPRTDYFKAEVEAIKAPRAEF